MNCHPTLCPVLIKGISWMNDLFSLMFKSNEYGEFLRREKPGGCLLTALLAVGPGLCSLGFITHAAGFFHEQLWFMNTCTLAPAGGITKNQGSGEHNVNNTEISHAIHGSFWQVVWSAIGAFILQVGCSRQQARATSLAPRSRCCETETAVNGDQCKYTAHSTYRNCAIQKQRLKGILVIRTHRRCLASGGL